MAADADQRKDALVEEVRAGAREAKERLQRDREEVDRDREALDRERREHREMQMAWRTQTEEADYQRRELQAKVEGLS